MFFFSKFIEHFSFLQLSLRRYMYDCLQLGFPGFIMGRSW